MSDIYINRIRGPRLEAIAAMQTREEQVAAYDALVADEMADFEAFAATIQVQTEDGALVPFNEWRDANRTP